MSLFAVLLTCNYFVSVLAVLLFRHGGGTGSEDIRKIAYFEQSIDPEILKVNIENIMQDLLLLGYRLE